MYQQTPLKVNMYKLNYVLSSCYYKDVLTALFELKQTLSFRLMVKTPEAY